MVIVYYHHSISSYSFRGNYSFLNLEIQRSQYIRVRKIFKGGNYSRAETIWGNTVYDYVITEDYSKYFVTRFILESGVAICHFWWLPPEKYYRSRCKLSCCAKAVKMLWFDGKLVRKLGLLSSALKGESAEAVEVMSHDLEISNDCRLSGKT